VWHFAAIASVLVPPLFINRGCHYASKYLTQAAQKRMAADVNAKLPAYLTPLGIKLSSSGVGLAMIPLIFKPIDHATDLLIHYVYRPIANKALGKNAVPVPPSAAAAAKIL
jgi:hypothetical protein